MGDPPTALREAGDPILEDTVRQRTDASSWWELVIVALILAAHFAYARAFIQRSSLLIGDQRYYCLFDDAVISMEYAKNWAAGHGPVWNEGQRVEGYTNFLWVCVMLGVHKLGQDPSSNCLIMQWLGETLLLANVLLTWLLARACGLPPAARLMAAVLMAGHYVATYWGVEGMETSLLSCVVTGAMIFISRSLRRGTISPTGMLILGLAPLVRPDSILVLGLAALWLFIFGRRHRRLTVVLAALSLAPTLLHMLWRHSYYGEWLPNTYYLKATGLPILNRLIDGIHFTWFSLARSFVLWAIVLAGLFFAPNRLAGLFLGAFGLTLAYQVWVGGDSWQRDRFVIPFLPGMFVAASDYLTRALAARIRSRPGRAGLALAAIPLFLGNFNYSYRTEWLLLDAPRFSRENEDNVRRALAIKELTDPDATLAVSWAGAPPYFADRRGVDLLGKSDPVIARLPADPSRHIPGHAKWDLRHSLDKLKPDVIAAEYLDIFVDQPAFALYNRFFVDFADEETSFFVRFDTEKVQTHRMRRVSTAPPRPSR